jgi:hypothetical protein
MEDTKNNRWKNIQKKNIKNAPGQTNVDKKINVANFKWGKNKFRKILKIKAQIKDKNNKQNNKHKK